MRQPSPRSTPERGEAGDATEALLARVRTLAGRGAHEQALSALAERGSNCAELHELEGIIHLDCGRHEQAIECFRMAAYWDPSTNAYARWLELARASRARALEPRVEP